MTVAFEFERAGRSPRIKRYALKCDNVATCAAANYGIVEKAVMREALRTWHDAEERIGNATRLIYIETKSNRIA